MTESTVKSSVALPKRLHERLVGEALRRGGKGKGHSIQSILVEAAEKMLETGTSKTTSPSTAVYEQTVTPSVSPDRISTDLYRLFTDATMEIGRLIQILHSTYAGIEAILHRVEARDGGETDRVPTGAQADAEQRLREADKLIERHQAGRRQDLPATGSEGAPGKRTGRRDR
jgi:DNA-binding transcriptional MerR regulator